MQDNRTVKKAYLVYNREPAPNQGKRFHAFDRNAGIEQDWERLAMRFRPVPGVWWEIVRIEAGDRIEMQQTFLDVESSDADFEQDS